MSVPDYETFMLPLLQLASDQKEHTLSAAYDSLAAQFNLTESERNDLLPSGRQPRFENRVGWARTYLKKAGLIDSVGRGKFRITQRGVDVVKSKPIHITKEFLTQFAEFREFQARQNAKAGNSEDTSNHESTPDEVLDSAYQLLRRTLAQDLLERVKSSSPRFFERVVVDLLLAMGYGGSDFDAGRIVCKRGDGGIDGIINEDKLGLDAIYIQAKRWNGTVGRPTVQEFAGSLAGQKARKGVLITTSHFSSDAREYAERLLEMKIVLLDGEQLAQLMIDHGVGVADKQVYAVKRIDEDFFVEE
jgi:restriction system protein